jgi:uncharacterized membrane protein YphA (DoxX/SURF4 family)
MKFLKRSWFYLFGLLTFLPHIVSAHEQYVLTSPQINADIAATGPSSWSALNDPVNFRIALCVFLGSLILFIIYFLFDHSKAGRRFESFTNRWEPWGHVILRIALAGSLIASAYFDSFLGPEIPIVSLPFAFIIKPALYVLGFMLIIGFWSEVAALLSLVILFIATYVYKDYMLSYINYLGEFVALIFVGSRIFSIDRVFYHRKFWVEHYQKYEVALIRITYGISVIYPAIVYKLMHPEVIVDIVTRYNLTQFHWLFPADPLLIALGTGIAQVVVGTCIILGFETRLNALITFTLMVLSVLFFKEAVWPHYILLALALYLMINNGGEWSLDHYFEEWNKKRKLKQEASRAF